MIKCHQFRFVKKSWVKSELNLIFSEFDAACLGWIKCFCDVTLISSCHHGFILFLFVESSLMAPQQVWLWSIFIFKVATDMFPPLSSSWSFGKLFDPWAGVDWTVRLCPLSVVSACQCRIKMRFAVTLKDLLKFLGVCLRVDQASGSGHQADAWSCWLGSAVLHLLWPKGAN